MDTEGIIESDFLEGLDRKVSYECRFDRPEDKVEGEIRFLHDVSVERVLSVPLEG
eukprot:CAMPEP_0202460812 /NCGR_PEP_ID=MMETSP1360-20130828/46036_1 /ASSEMBLY_ACC=CAM_ASM_000848 /TAXON_ID=515479 /ORGANISM="Licmophora paradoxa, Strain CCMP2313" /LENGTH=54 /DNA_ID=CAMNT_0049082623 /DNA_START=352 /DNA_END=516 /DNA_ORIENTATION=-